MDVEVTPDPLDASFDLVARQDAAEAALGELRGDVDEVKSRLDKVSRAAARPALSGASSASPELKGFVDGYLRQGRETELKAVTGAVAADGGFAVPREIDAMIAAQLKTISPIRAIAQVVQVGTAGYRKLVSSWGTASGWVSETAAAAGDGEPCLRRDRAAFGRALCQPVGQPGDARRCRLRP